MSGGQPDNKYFAAFGSTFAKLHLGALEKGTNWATHD
jgi:hypothetical protein